MRYCVSDLHGEYGLFLKLLDKINFCEGDELYVLGDIIDKGDSSVRLLKYISERDNIHCILGNHEHAFLEYYHSLLEESPDDFCEVLSRLREYFPKDGHLLDFELVDWLESLPAYIEGDGFVCVHAGVPVKPDGTLLPLAEATVNQLVFDRRFKNKDTRHSSPVCVFFGHTQTDNVCGRPVVLGYKRRADAPSDSLSSFYKIHLDTGTWSNGVLGCFCIDTCKTVYARKPV